MGPSLCKAGKTGGEQVEGNWNGGCKVLQSMFLGDVNENEIRSIVTKSKNKKSTDSDGLDMVIVKRTIDAKICNPLCYIFNLSFHKGIFYR